MATIGPHRMRAMLQVAPAPSDAAGFAVEVGHAAGVVVREQLRQTKREKTVSGQCRSSLCMESGQSVAAKFYQKAASVAPEEKRWWQRKLGANFEDMW